MDLKLISIFAIVLVLLYLVFCPHAKGLFEKFDDDIYNKINRGLNTILGCEKDHSSCDPNNKNIVRDFPSFKRVFNWPKFNVLLYMKLMKLRRQKGSAMTNAEIDKLINEGKYQDSFYSPPAQATPETVKAEVKQSTLPAKKLQALQPKPVVKVQAKK